MKKIIVLVLIVIVLFSGLCLVYLIDMDKMNNNKRVLFSTWGHKYTPQANENNDKKIKSNLTLEIIYNMIVKRGDKLTWSDFEQYQSIEVGSGLYILSYEIDNDYRLLIGGIPTEEPMYIRLISKNDNEQYIDIRYDNLEEFLNKTK